MTTHTQQSANAREVAGLGPMHLAPFFVFLSRHFLTILRNHILSVARVRALQRNQDEEHGSTTDMCAWKRDLPPHTL